jgi:geranyl-CoA carboxylase alpha subunit
VLVKAAERVAAGQPVITLEAMKMQHVHSAGMAGIVASVEGVEEEQGSLGKVLVAIAEG